MRWRWSAESCRWHSRADGDVAGPCTWFQSSAHRIPRSIPLCARTEHLPTAALHTSVVAVQNYILLKVETEGRALATAWAVDNYFLLRQGYYHSTVCPSVCPLPDPKARMEGHSKMKIGRKKAHDTRDPWIHLKVERQKVKVSTGRLTLRRKMCHIFRSRRPTNFKLRTEMEHDNRHQRHACWPQKSR